MNRRLSKFFLDPREAEDFCRVMDDDAREPLLVPSEHAEDKARQGQQARVLGYHVHYWAEPSFEGIAKANR